MDIDLDKPSLAVGEAWKPDHAAEFNRLWSLTPTRETFAKNLSLLMKSKALVGKDKYDTADKLSKFTGLSLGATVHVLDGLMTYHYACCICFKLGVGLGQMLKAELAEEDIRLRIPMAS